VNRTDRLHAISEELRRAGTAGRTAAQLATWLEVSTRTIKRDVAALQQAGLPVWAQAGPGGGYALDAVATLPPVNLTETQAVAIAVALAARADAPYATEGRVALEKILGVMEPGARRRAETLGRRVWVRGSDRPPGRLTDAVEQGLAARTVISLTYQDRHGQVSKRRVEPHLIARTDHRWYLIAWCQERQAVRWFRWDRIVAADLTTQPVPDRDLTTFGTPPPDAHPAR
jgi:predicted DNA-binding transcriptional regulator YafY